jgi:hypothetical protein
MSDFGDEVIPANVARIVFPSQGKQCLNDKRMTHRHYINEKSQIQGMHATPLAK